MTQQYIARSGMCRAIQLKLDPNATPLVIEFANFVFSTASCAYYFGDLILDDNTQKPNKCENLNPSQSPFRIACRKTILLPKNAQKEV